ncbi:histidine phosphatase family protein [Pseudooceanicola sp.]|uniref:histidine phosphatase family protein n=1 Tax=Pseudooceanicola sp. TaxID=1914328 RepID=UPI0035C6ABEE
MVKRLILLRHAKSSWSNPELSDHDRPLNKRGRKSAKAIGKWLQDIGITPDLTLCSDAVRARETCKRLKLGGEIQVRPDLYMASADKMLEAMQEAEGACVLMVAHNPGIADFAQRLVTTPPPHGRFADFPTGATLIVDIPMVDWKAGHFGTSRVVNFITPRELIGKDEKS